MAKKSSKSRALSVYSNLTSGKGRKGKKVTASKERAAYLASLPKHPLRRALYRLHPKRFWAYWFSRRGLIMALKIAGVSILLLALLIGGLFAYISKDLDQIRPGELAKRVQSTVNTYYDRNGELLWEDKGDGNYKLVVESNELSDYLKQATVAIEDRDFFKHSGVSFTGTLRAVVNNAAGGEVQGGSTLTQQLVKQVFFADESTDRGFGGIPRKIKELILSIEVERMYDKDQILTLYLNESPYGGRRNGAESGAQTYFGKSAKDLSLAEAALLAAIPQNPAVYDPYNVYGHEGLIARQHRVIDSMQEVGYITKEQADEAKAIPILDSVKPEVSQYSDIKAAHFVQMVRSQLEEELGTGVVGRGGLSITTTLDIRIQNKLEEAMDKMFASTTPASAGFTNGAATVEDSQTGQIVALLGSRDFDYEGYGQDNAATAYIQPGSTIKPLVYSELFEQKPSGEANYGSGSVLVDENIDATYGGPLRNADGAFKGPLPIRVSLATSRNIPAVKAMAISGVQPTLETIRALGATSYCTQGADAQAQLSAAIGGCGIRQVDLANGFASLARGGVYKPQSSVLEVKDTAGSVLKKWSDTSGTQVISSQSAYILSDILTDREARATFANTSAMNIKDVKTATKTGTSDKGGKAKDIWMMSYSPALTMSVWLGNPDTSILGARATSIIPGPIIESVMSYAHLEIYKNDGRWKIGDWFTKPAGIQNDGKELYPSWWSKTQGQSNAKLMFDMVSKRKATACTPPAAKIELDVIKSTDPISKKDYYTNVPDGYDSTEEDNVHSCADSIPTIGGIIVTGSSPNYTIKFNVTAGSPFTIGGDSVKLVINGTTISSFTQAGNTYTATYSGAGPISGTITVTDSGYYQASANISHS